VRVERIAARHRREREIGRPVDRGVDHASL
jgi:hypothetical protein